MITPQLAKEATLTSLEHYIDNDLWVMEQKLDGNRLLVCSPGGDYPPTTLTRSGSPYTKKIPKALSEFRFPEGNGAMDFIIDGELVGESVNGHTVSQTFWVFDIPFVANILDPSATLRQRRFLLEQTFEFWSQGNPAMKLVPQAKTRDEKIALAEKALKENFEGLLLKRLDAPYRSGGRTEEWLKVKFVTTADCVVLDVRDDGKDSVRLGMVEFVDGVVDQFKIVDVGRASLIGKEKAGTIAKGDVIEVRYLYTGAGGRLYQPTIMRKRTDKPMHECTTDQLKHVNKTVMAAL